MACEWLFWKRYMMNWLYNMIFYIFFIIITKTFNIYNHKLFYIYSLAYADFFSAFFVKTFLKRSKYNMRKQTIHVPKENDKLEKDINEKKEWPEIFFLRLHHYFNKTYNKVFQLLLFQFRKTLNAEILSRVLTNAQNWSRCCGQSVNFIKSRLNQSEAMNDPISL